MSLREGPSKDQQIRVHLFSGRSGVFVSVSGGPVRSAETGARRVQCVGCRACCRWRHEGLLGERTFGWRSSEIEGWGV